MVIVCWADTNEIVKKPVKDFHSRSSYDEVLISLVKNSRTNCIGEILRRTQGCKDVIQLCSAFNKYVDSYINFYVSIDSIIN